MIKVLLITRQFPYPLHGGEMVAIDALMRAMKDSSVSYDLFSLNTSKHYYTGDIYDTTLSEYFDNITTVDVDNRLWSFSSILKVLGGESPFLGRFKHQKVHDQLAQWLTDHEYDIIQIEGLQMTVYVNTIRSNSRAEIILRAHNVESSIWSQWQQQESIIRKLILKPWVTHYQKLEATLCRDVDMIMTMTKENTDWFNQFHDRVKTLFVPFDSKQSHLLPSKKSVKFGLIAAMDWKPNAAGLKWYLKNIHPHVSHISGYQLIIAGRKTNTIEKSFHQLQNIQWLGEIDQASRFWSEIDVLIVPIHIGSGVRIKILEAMAHHVAVISTVVGIKGIAAINGQEAWIFNDVHQWITTIRQICNDRSLLIPKIENAGLLLKNNYHPEMIRKSLISIYNSILDNRPL